MNLLTPKSQFINWNSRIPKYRQVANTILWEIEQKVFKAGDRLPSINETSAEYYLSRDTIEKAYRELSQRGIITSVPGKGYYVNKFPRQAALKIVLMLSKLDNYNVEIYKSLYQKLGSKTNLSIFIHHHDVRLFQSFIYDNLGFYDYYMVSANFQQQAEIASKTLSKIPPNKLILLDKDFPSLTPGYGLIYQDFSKELKTGLSKKVDLIKRYKKLVLIYPCNKKYPREIKRGFSLFCRAANIAFDAQTCLQESDIERDHAYMFLEEDDLFRFVKYCQNRRWVLGRDVGVISYNDSPAKELIEGGITVLGKDYETMGEQAAQMILSGKRQKIRNPFKLTIRNSL